MKTHPITGCKRRKKRGRKPYICPHFLRLSFQAFRFLVLGVGGGEARAEGLREGGGRKPAGLGPRLCCAAAATTRTLSGPGTWRAQCQQPGERLEDRAPHAGWETGKEPAKESWKSAFLLIPHCEVLCPLPRRPLARRISLGSEKGLLVVTPSACCSATFFYLCPGPGSWAGVSAARNLGFQLNIPKKGI